RPCKQMPGARGALTSRRIPIIEAAEFDSEHRSLNPFQAVIISQHLVIVFAGLPMIAKDLYGFAVLRIICNYRSRFAKCAKIFARIKAEASHIAEAARASAFISRSVRLRRIFDDK